MAGAPKIVTREFEPRRDPPAGTFTGFVAILGAPAIVRGGRRKRKEPERTGSGYFASITSVPKESGGMATA
jgi:hypothetical protein